MAEKRQWASMTPAEKLDECKAAIRAAEEAEFIPIVQEMEAAGLGPRDLLPMLQAAKETGMLGKIRSGHTLDKSDGRVMVDWLRNNGYADTADRVMGKRQMPGKAAQA